MTLTQRAEDIFDDARAMHEASLERLTAGDIRDAAEKAWCATKRATEALILTRTGSPPRLPSNTSQVSRGIRVLGLEGGLFKSLQDRFGACARYLHSDCFFNGNCEPQESTEGFRSVWDDGLLSVETPVSLLCNPSL